MYIFPPKSIERTLFFAILTQSCRDPLNWSWAHYHDAVCPGTKCLPRNRIYDKIKTNSDHKLTRVEWIKFKGNNA